MTSNTPVSTPGPATKLKIKMATPTVSPGHQQDQGEHQPAIPKIKLKLGGGSVTIQPESGSSKSHSSSSSKKRSSSSAKLSDKLEGPAAKMARAMGSDPTRETRIFEESFKKSGSSKESSKVVKPRLLPQL